MGSWHAGESAVHILSRVTDSLSQGHEGHGINNTISQSIMSMHGTRYSIAIYRAYLNLLNLNVERSRQHDNARDRWSVPGPIGR